ncbi:hypothetical protein SteCoe_35421 [Stentor coeruleus]|uniref:Uncharacterized protein n=1 Tax=Stentor coeruleus TaxID=5963 RepID=A0A1R2ASC4_9CILI|nr:hypothetical protein SteCoe_35421 [Stentor coeruleus]
METIHYISITFQESTDLDKSIKTDKVINPLLKDVFPLPKISKSPVSKTLSPIPNKAKFLVEDLPSLNKTMIFSVEEKFSDVKPMQKVTNKPYHTKNINENTKYYLKFYDRIDKQQLKRLKKQTQRKPMKRDNPWRYNINAANSVFDVALLAQNTFSPNSGKKNLSV